jgi:hypothetical protein
MSWWFEVCVAWERKRKQAQHSPSRMRSVDDRPLASITSLSSRFRANTDFLNACSAVHLESAEETLMDPSCWVVGPGGP